LSIVARNTGKASGNGKAASNGHRAPDGKVRVAIVGVGNCASSLVQGRYYYADAKDGDFVPGLMHVNLGGYHVRDIEFVAAWIAGAYWFTSSTSFANPAVTLGRALTDSFAGIRPLDAPGFVIAQLAGAAAGVLIAGRTLGARFAHGRGGVA